MWIRWRISEVWQKALYIVCSWGIGALFLLVMRTWLLDARSWPYAVVVMVVNLIIQVVGVRVFRGYLEPLMPPRSWWRWTGRPKAGFWLGSLNVITAISVLHEGLPSRGLGPDPSAVIVDVFGYVVVAFGYLNSSFRLLRHPELWSQRRRESRYVREA